MRPSRTKLRIRVLRGLLAGVPPGTHPERSCLDRLLAAGLVRTVVVGPNSEKVLQVTVEGEAWLEAALRFDRPADEL